MAKEPKFDTGAMIKSLKTAGVEHPEAHTEAHVTATENVYSKTESKLMNAESVTKVFESFDERTGDMKLEMQKISHKIEDTRKDIQNIRLKLFVQLSGVIVGTAVVVGVILEVVRSFLH